MVQKKNVPLEDTMKALKLYSKWGFIRGELKSLWSDELIKMQRAVDKSFVRV